MSKLTIAILVALIATLAGCTGLTPVKIAADRVCDATAAEQSVMAERFDRATHPHSIRVHCDVQP